MNTSLIVCETNTLYKSWNMSKHKTLSIAIANSIVLTSYEIGAINVTFIQDDNFTSK